MALIYQFFSFSLPALSLRRCAPLLHAFHLFRFTSLQLCLRAALLFPCIVTWDGIRQRNKFNLHPVFYERIWLMAKNEPNTIGNVERSLANFGRDQTREVCWNEVSRGQSLDETCLQLLKSAFVLNPDSFVLHLSGWNFVILFAPSKNSTPTFF